MLRKPLVILALEDQRNEPQLQPAHLEQSPYSTHVTQRHSKRTCSLNSLEESSQTATENTKILGYSFKT